MTKSRLGTIRSPVGNQLSNRLTRRADVSATMRRRPRNSKSESMSSLSARCERSDLEQGLRHHVQSRQTDFFETAGGGSRSPDTFVTGINRTAARLITRRSSRTGARSTGSVDLYSGLIYRPD